jgi:hypothetical protein
MHNATHRENIIAERATAGHPHTQRPHFFILKLFSAKQDNWPTLGSAVTGDDERRGNAVDIQCAFSTLCGNVPCLCPYQTFRVYRPHPYHRGGTARARRGWRRDLNAVGRVVGGVAKQAWGAVGNAVVGPAPPRRYRPLIAVGRDGRIAIRVVGIARNR